MKRKVRITETQLNTIIKRALKEQQEEDQVMTGVDQEKMAGGPEDEGGEPDYEGFMSAAKDLMGKGITIGNLVDKLCEAKDTESEPEPESDNQIGSDQETEPEIPASPMAESRKRR
jgi:hypothetical protein